MGAYGDLEQQHLHAELLAAAAPDPSAAVAAAGGGPAAAAGVEDTDAVVKRLGTQLRAMFGAAAAAVERCTSFTGGTEVRWGGGGGGCGAALCVRHRGDRGAVGRGGGGPGFNIHHPLSCSSAACSSPPLPPLVPPPPFPQLRSLLKVLDSELASYLAGLQSCLTQLHTRIMSGRRGSAGGGGGRQARGRQGAGGSRICRGCRGGAGQGGGLLGVGREPRVGQGGDKGRGRWCRQFRNAWRGEGARG